MSQYDVAVGADEATLDKVMRQLHANPDTREKYFKGQREGQDLGEGEGPPLSYRVRWDVQTPPTWTILPPPADLWSASFDLQGNHPQPGARPTVNAFQLVFPQFHAEYTLEGASPVSGTGKVIIVATVENRPDGPMIQPQAVWFDSSRMSAFDKHIIRILLGQVGQQVQDMLAKLHVPPLVVAEVALTRPKVVTAGRRLVMAASLQSRGSVDIGGVTWPNQPFFILLSEALLTTVARRLANEELVGKEYTGKGTYKRVFKYDWTFKLIELASLAFNRSDMTKASAKARFSFGATMKVLGLGGPCAIKAATKAM